MGTVNLEAVRFKARKVAPYFGTVIWGLRPVEVPGCGTFSVTDDGQFVYDPNVDWTFEEQVGVFIHELHHVVLGHAERCGARDRKMWNIATDIEINNSLRRGGIVLPKGALMPENFNLPQNQAAEVYYQAIQGMIPEQQPKFPDSSKPGAGRCGSVAGGIKEEFEPEPDGNAATAGQNTGGQQSGKTEVEMAAMRRRVAEEIMKDIGNAPGNLVDWARQQITPTTPWQSALRAAVKRAIHTVAGGATDYTYSRTNDRTLDPDLILPTLITKKPELAVIVDTSGSISREELDEAIAEVASVLRAHANRMTIMAVDTKVHEVHTVAVSSKVETLKFSGGGGTDLRVGFDYALKLRPKPNIVIVFTDAFTPWPKYKPDAEVIVCLTRHGDESRVPKWARTLRVGGNRKHGIQDSI